MRKLLFLVVTVLLAFSSCQTEIDNYSVPDATLTGTVTDAITGEPLRTEQPNGFRVRYKEQNENYPNAQNYYFWGKPDGTFNNSKVFSGKYEVQVQEGPFITPEIQEVIIEGKTVVNFTVIPYLVIKNESVNLNGNILHVTFNIERPSQVSATPKTAFVAIAWNPNVSYNTYGNSGILKTQNLSNDNLSKAITFDIDISKLEKGHHWYVRMGASTTARSDRFNYSNLYEFEY